MLPYNRIKDKKTNDQNEIWLKVTATRKHPNVIDILKQKNVRKFCHKNYVIFHGKCPNGNCEDDNKSSHLLRHVREMELSHIWNRIRMLN